MSNKRSSSQEKLPTPTAKPNVGGKYEISVAALVAATLSINKQIENYRVFTNVNEAQPFDDVVAVVFFKGESAPYAYAIQVKHHGKGEPLGVKKYLDGYTKILKKGGFETVGKIAANNIHFCYFCIKHVWSYGYKCQAYNPTTESWRSALSFKNCYKLSCEDQKNQRNKDFLNKFYLYLDQPDLDHINENIESVCNINNATDILNYVDGFYNKMELWERGLAKDIFESELLKIRLSNYILPPTDIIQLNNSQVAIWNNLTLQHDVTIVKSEDNIEESLYGCLAQKLNDDLNTVVDWNKCKTTLDSSVSSEFKKLFLVGPRHWIDPPTTLTSLIIELWKCRKLPLILKGDDPLSVLKDYAHLNKSYIIVTDNLVSRREEFDRYNLKVFACVRDIECFNTRDELLNAISISLQGRKPITLYTIAAHTEQLLCSHLLRLMRSREAYLSKECLEGDHNMVFLIEDPESSAEYSLDRLNKVGGNIAIQCQRGDVRRYREQIENGRKFHNYKIYHCKKSENENFTLIEGNKTLLEDFFVDQYGESVHVLENIPVPIIGPSLENIQNSYIPRFLRTAVIKKTLFDSPTKGICFFTGDLRYLDENIMEYVVEASLDTIKESMQSQKENVFVHIKHEDVDKYWKETSILERPLLHIRVEGTDMELLKCKNWKGLSDYITYSGRRISEEIFLTEITDGITVLTGEPGMGKSSLLRSLFKNHAGEKYVLFYNLVDYGRYLARHNLVPNNISIDFIFNQFKSREYNEFLSSLYATKQNVLVLLDAFDEVLPKYKKKVLKFIGNLAKNNIQIIIATRSIADYLLIDSFGTRTFKVDILGEDDRNEYIKSCNLPEQKLNSVPREFLENPLYLNFLKIIFDSHTSLTNLNKQTLYEAVLKIKLDEYFERNYYNADKSDKEYLLKPVRELHDRLALVITLGEDVVSRFLGGNLERGELSNKHKLGIIESIDQHGYPTFVHKTFAEYLTADWLVRNIREDVAKNIYDEMIKHKNLHLLDILYEDLELHKAIIQENIFDVCVLAKKASNLSAVDKLGRTALHAATICYHMKRYVVGVIDIIVEEMCRNQCDFMQSNLLIPWDWQYHIYINSDFPKYLPEPILEIYINTLKRKLEKDDKVARNFWFEEFNNFVWRAMKTPSMERIRDLLYIKNYGIDSNFDRLYRACLNSDNEILETVALNTKVADGLTPLHIACVYGNVNVAKRLVDLKSDVNAIDDFHNTPLHYSVINTQEIAAEMTKLLLEAGANLNRENETPLFNAVRMGNLYVVKLLLEHGGLCTNIIIENIEALLHVAVESGANLNYKGCSLSTRLSFALRTEKSNVVRLLREHGISTSNVNKKFEGPSTVAVNKENLDIMESLLEYSARMNDADKYVSFAFRYAAAIGNIDMMKFLLGKDVNVNSRSANGETPLFIAAKEDNADMMQLLLEKNADPNCTTKRGASPLFVNAKLICSGSAKILLDYGAMVNSATIRGETPIFAASAANHKENVNLFLNYGADVNCTTRNGKTPLFIACAKGSSDVIQLLLENKANVNQANVNGKSPLFVACQKGNVHLVKLLLDNGADVNQANRDGESLLFFLSSRHYSTHGGFSTRRLAKRVPDYTDCYTELAEDRLNIVKLLLERGANVNSANKNGETPISIASKVGLFNVVKLLLQYGADMSDISELFCAAVSAGNLDVVKLLMEKGVEVNKPDCSGKPPLLHAARSERPDMVIFLMINHGRSECLDMVKFLIEADANVNAVDNDGLTALSHAADVNNLQIVNLLLSNGADVNIGCPLYYAAHHRDLTIAKLLLTAGSKVNLKGSPFYGSGATPLFEAVSHANVNQVKLLLEHGADVTVVDESNQNALFRVFSRAFPKYNDELRLDIVKLLLDYNANVSEECLGAAVKTGCKPLVKLLSKKS